MERRIEDDTHADMSDRAAEPLASAPADVSDDELSVIEREGEVAVIRDLQPDPAATEVVEDVPIAQIADDVIEVPPAETIPRIDPSAAPDGATGTRYRMLVAGHVASDVFCLNVVLFMTKLLDDIIDTRALGGVGWLLAIVASLAWVAIFHSFGLYASRHFNSSEEIRRVVGATSVGAAVLMIFGAGVLQTQGTLAIALVTLVGLEIVTRLAWRRYARSLRAKGLLAYRTMIVGSAHEAAFVTDSLAEDDRSGFYPDRPHRDGPRHRGS